MNIYVSNLSFTTQDEDLKNLFIAYGEVRSAKVITDKVSGRSRGFGFVEMADTTSGEKAITALHSGNVDGRQISVTIAKPRESKPSYGSGYGDNKKSYSKNPW